METTLSMQKSLIEALEGLIDSESAEQSDEAVKHAKSVIERAKEETFNNIITIRLTRKISTQISQDDSRITYKTVDIEFKNREGSFNPHAEVTPETISDLQNNDVVAVEIIQ